MAQTHLAQLYMDGQQAPQNWEIVYAPFNLAANDATTNAAISIVLAAEQLSARDLAEAERLSKDIARPNNLKRAIEAYLRLSI
ncbi:MULTISPECIES: hypothetical protein [Chitinilyticum]|uniref:Uncharacterized protein n=1 Tax=Chitinilyticum piscinae TaxID=2866724 RepID=A0A8J7FGL3_9NEIS|nr:MULTISPECIES: hypothetical protein [Chitinilyticum]MBE9607740.1 hypothetical protein [Chitinilyticum piscinae]